MNTRFRSKVDAPLALLGCATPVVALVAIGSNLAPGHRVRLVLALGVAVLAGVLLWILLSTSYEITSEHLVVRAGPMRWRIPLREITGVSASRSPRSGPALSMDRLEVRWGAASVLLISPADQDGFLAAMRRRVPRLAPPRAPFRPD